ncbi:MAG: TonB-dependent receptor plug domain-containing protein [Vicinamibacterales bacterium]
MPRLFDTVVVTANRESQPTREITSNVTVLDGDTITSSTAKTVTDLIIEQGFNSASYGDVAGVQIRGFGQLSGTPEHTNTVLVLLNGRRTGNANLTLIGLKNVERVEIIRGPSAVQYRLVRDGRCNQHHHQAWGRGTERVARARCGQRQSHARAVDAQRCGTRFRRRPRRVELWTLRRHRIGRTTVVSHGDRSQHERQRRRRLFVQ